MSRTAEEYQQLFQSLLPPGDIWKSLSTKVMIKLLLGLATEYSRMEERSDDLLTERNSLYTTELLEEFEAEYGIPEDGLELEPTIDRRRNVVHAKVIAIGDQDKDYFEAIAAALGYTIEIEEFAPAWVGVVTVGENVGDQDVLFRWIVWIDSTTIEYSIDVNITQLIHDITKVKPGHTEVFFRWKGDEFSRAFGRGFDSIPHFDNYWNDIEMSFDGGFSSAFTNNKDYYGVNYTGPFAQAFSIDFDRYSGGECSKDFAQAFSQLN